MDERQILRLRLMADFIGGFFNYNDEFIAHKYSNTYFRFDNCENEFDVKCKLLEWFSRPATKGQPYVSEWRNKKYRQFILGGINQFLHTNFTFEQMEVIYQELGNCICHNKTIKFIESGYDFIVLN